MRARAHVRYTLCFITTTSAVRAQQIFYLFSDPRPPGEFPAGRSFRFFRVWWVSRFTTKWRWPPPPQRPPRRSPRHRPSPRPRLPPTRRRRRTCWCAVNGGKFVGCTEIRKNITDSCTEQQKNSHHRLRPLASTAAVVAAEPRSWNSSKCLLYLSCHHRPGPSIGQSLMTYISWC